jgi:hypothetical protein
VQLVFQDAPKRRHGPPTSQRIRGQTGAGNQRAADVWDSIVERKVQ